MNIVEFTKGEFSTPSTYSVIRTFKGLVQPQSSSVSYNNGKDTSMISAILYCSVNEVFDPKELIEYNGCRYKISGNNSQKDGISGIQAKRSQHAEYNLEYAQGGL